MTTVGDSSIATPCEREACLTSRRFPCSPGRNPGQFRSRGHPIVFAFDEGDGPGATHWKAGDPGDQMIP